MALHFYIGGAGGSKTEVMLHDVIRQSLEEPDRRFFVIVPEQMTMEMQRRVVRLHPRHAILNLEVTSLLRLALRVFDETGQCRESMLEEIGKTFLLTKAALEVRKELPSLGRNLNRPEYLAEMKSLFSELMLYGAEPSELIEAGEENGQLRAKLRDVSHLYEAFRKKLEGSYLTSEEIPDRFAEAVPASALLENAVVALDGFTGFTPVQYRLLGALLKRTGEFMLTLSADPERPVPAGWRETELFGLSYETVSALRELAGRRTRVYFHAVEDGDGDSSRGGAVSRGSSPAGSAAESVRPAELVFLEKNIFRPGRRVYKGNADHVHLMCAGDPREESEAAASEIARLVRERGLRYRDIAIVTGNPDSYAVCMPEALERCGIPYFLDRKREIVHNPFIEYLRAALEACAEHYSFDGMFRMLKCGMAGFDEEAVWHLENYALGTGLKGRKRWREPFRRLYAGENPAELPLLENLRKEILGRLDPLADALARRGGTVREKTEALRRFIEESGAEERLLREEERCMAEGMPELAREYAQVYPYVTGFLDKLEAALGEEKITLPDFRALIEAGFAEGRIAVIPPGNDCVLVGDVERSRVPDVKVLFFSGVNEGQVPKTQNGSGLLTESDRERLKEAGIRLKPTAREAVYIEQFYLYSMLARPSEELYLSWTQTTAGGESASPSYLVDAVRRILPSAGESQTAGTFFRTAEGAASASVLPERMEAGKRLLSRKLRELGETPPGENFRELFAFYRRTPEYAFFAERIVRAASRRNPADHIGKAAVRALYGKELRNSASRLELFASCAFAHFLRYGLRLKERPEYEFTGMDFGNLMHRSLELMGGELAGRAVTVEDLDEENLKDLSRRAIGRAAEEVRTSSPLYDTARDEYRLTKMARLAEASVKTILTQLLSGKFIITCVEEDFRTREEMDVLRLKLPGGAAMILTGRIDRIDTWENQGSTYVKVVDYKTGGTEYDPAKIYYGLQLQLALYMNAASEILRREGKHPVPAGMFYYRVQDPVLAWKSGEGPSALGERRLRENRGSGVILEDDVVIRALDGELVPGSESPVIQVSLNKDGSVSKKSKVLGEEAFRDLLDCADRRIRGLAEAMMAGEAEVNPYRYGEETPCTFCAYREICGFDTRIPGYAYRVLAKMGADEVLSKIHAEEDGKSAKSGDEKSKGGRTGEAKA